MSDNSDFMELLKDLCVGVATLAHGTVNILGRDKALEVVEAASAMSYWLDGQEIRNRLDDEDE